MSSVDKRAIGGAVAFEDDSMLFIANALTKKEQSLTSTAQTVKSSIKNRWAYMAIGYKESETLRANNSEPEALLKALQKKYQNDLINTVDNYDWITLNEIRDMKISYDGKEIYLKSSKMSQTNSIEELLLAERMFTQAKNLKDSHKKKTEKITRMSLKFTKKETQKLLSDDHVFAIVALAYAYKEVDEVLELVDFPEVQVAFVPRVRLECGVFFDGTLNNMYNTKMRKAYEAYFELKVDMISGINIETKHTWETKILDLKVPRSSLMLLILKDLQSQMITIYGTERKSEDEYNDGIIFGWLQDDVSKDCDAIYEYFRDSGIQKLLNKIKEVQNDSDIFSEDKKLLIKELKKEAYEGKQAYLSKENHIDSYIEEKILMGDSYTGALSNVVKLYDVYQEDDNTQGHSHSHLYESFKRKIYITGAGTHYDKNGKNHQEDDLFLGQALAIGDAGVKAKVNEACRQLYKIVAGIEHEYIDSLVLDVFGFSRGAAQARHFVGSLCKDLNCSFKRTLDNGHFEYELSKDGKNLYSHILNEDVDTNTNIVIDKIIIRFVGIFDTVPHYGLFQGSEKNSLELKLEANKVSRVVHLTAKEEFRYNFDLVSIFSKHTKKDGIKIEGSFEEKEFCGAHSDIGGGYRDNKSETIKLSTERKYGESKFFDKEVKNKIKRWNDNNHWITGKVYIDFYNNADEIGSKGDGFYIKKNIYTNDGEVKEKISYFHIYMYRKNIDTEYSQIPLEYMYKQAKEFAPFGELKNLTYKKMDELNNAKELKEGTKQYATIKSQFFHHSISLGIANKPNRSRDKKEFYDKRDIHYLD